MKHTPSTADASSALVFNPNLLNAVNSAPASNSPFSPDLPRAVNPAPASNSRTTDPSRSHEEGAKHTWAISKTENKKRELIDLTNETPPASPQPAAPVKAKTQKQLQPNEDLSLKHLASRKGGSLKATGTANQGMCQGMSHPFSNLSSSQSSALGARLISIGNQVFEMITNAQGVQYVRAIEHSAQPPTSHPSSQPTPVTKNTNLASPQPFAPLMIQKH